MSVDILKAMKNTFVIPEQKTNAINLPAHVLTWNYEKSSFEKEASTSDIELYKDILNSVHNPSRKTIKILERLLTKYAENPKILSLKAQLFISMKKLKKANKAIKQNFESNPTDLYARINYADMCLRQGRITLIPSIFENKWSLVQMYPKKKHHYFADFRLFIVFMGFYKLRIKEYEAAKQYYYLASKIDPSHKSVQRLKKQIVSQPFLLSSIVKKWFQGARKKR